MALPAAADVDQRFLYVKLFPHISLQMSLELWAWLSSNKILLYFSPSTTIAILLTIDCFPPPLVIRRYLLIQVGKALEVVIGHDSVERISPNRCLSNFVSASEV